MKKQDREKLAKAVAIKMMGAMAQGGGIDATDTDYVALKAEGMNVFPSEFGNTCIWEDTDNHKYYIEVAHNRKSAVKYHAEDYENYVHLARQLCDGLTEKHLMQLYDEAEVLKKPGAQSLYNRLMEDYEQFWHYNFGEGYTEELYFEGELEGKVSDLQASLGVKQTIINTQFEENQSLKARIAELEKELKEKPKVEAPKPKKTAKTTKAKPKKVAKVENYTLDERQKTAEKFATEHKLSATTEGKWLWIEGDTRPLKDELKKLGAWWSAKRKAWYLMPAVA